MSSQVCKDWHKIASGWAAAVRVAGPPVKRLKFEQPVTVAVFAWRLLRGPGYCSRTVDLPRPSAFFSSSSCLLSHASLSVTVVTVALPTRDVEFKCLTGNSRDY